MGLLLALLAAHLAVLMLFNLSPRRAVQQAQERLRIWLLPVALPTPEQEKKPRPQAQLRPRLSSLMPLPSSLPPGAAAEAKPMDAMPSQPGTPDAGAAAQQSGSTDGLAPLNLNLPARSASGPLSMQRNPALDDPRTNTPRLSRWERFAITLGTLECVIDERMPDGSIVRHAGRLKRLASSGSQRDPFGHSPGSGGGMGDVSNPLAGGTSSGGGRDSGTVAVCVR